MKERTGVFQIWYLCVDASVVADDGGRANQFHPASASIINHLARPLLDEPSGCIHLLLNNFAVTVAPIGCLAGVSEDAKSERVYACMCVNTRVVQCVCVCVCG